MQAGGRRDGSRQGGGEIGEQTGREGWLSPSLSTYVCIVRIEHSRADEARTAATGQGPGRRESRRAVQTAINSGSGTAGSSHRPSLRRGSASRGDESGRRLL